jgi:large exoprotein involved in heme utilization and adhesion
MIAADAFLLDDAGIDAVATSSGNGGVVDIRGTQLTIQNNATINVSARAGQGDAGRISLTAETIDVNQARILTTTESSGAGGLVNITTDQFSISNGAAISSNSQGAGAGGSVMIAADEFLQDDARIEAVATSSGNGGVVDISGTQITLQKNATINVSARAGQGDAGRINLAAENLFINNGQLSSDTTGEGLGGNIDLSGSLIRLTDEAQVSSSASGLANAGNINIDATNRFDLIASSIQSEALNSGGGSINITAIQRIEIDNSIVSASASGLTRGDDGGNISIDPILFTLRQSSIIAQANVGDGGNITLAATNFIADTQTLISASSRQGIDGSVAIESPNQAVNPVQAILDTGFLQLPEFVNKLCARESADQRSYLVVENMNPLRRDPNDYLPIFNESTVPTHMNAVSMAVANADCRAI